MKSLATDRDVLRTIYGAVNLNGTPLGGAVGFNSTKGGVGIYTVRALPALRSLTSFLAVPTGQNVAAAVTGSTPDGIVTVQVFATSTYVATDASFYFVMTGRA